MQIIVKARQAMRAAAYFHVTRRMLIRADIENALPEVFSIYSAGLRVGITVFLMDRPEELTEVIAVIRNGVGDNRELICILKC